MQRAIDYLEGELDSLQDAYETTEGETKYQYGIWEEEVRDAIEYLKKANGEQNTKVSEHHKTKASSITDVSGSMADKVQMINALTNIIAINRNEFGCYQSIRDNALEKLDKLIKSIDI